MKVCILTTAFPRWPGDHRAPFIYHAASAIRNGGHGVRVIAMHNPGALTRETMDGLEVIRPRYLPEQWEILQKDRGGIPSAWRSNPIARAALPPFLAVHTLAAARYARDCDLIHANWTLSAIAAWLSFPIHRKPYVVTVHGSDIFQGSRLPLVGAITRIALQRAAFVIAVSTELARAVEAMGIPRSKIRVIPDGVDTTCFHPHPGSREPVILFAGSLVKQKGIDVLLRAFSQAAGSLPDYRLEIAGDGPALDELASLSQSLGIGPKVTFPGSLSQAEIGERMRRASLFVLPSLSEGLGVVLLEAIASGTPCVASQTGGIPDVITPQVGRLVPPGDVTALGSAILAILQDPAAYQAMSRQARQRAVDTFSWDRVGSQICQLYREVLGTKIGNSK